MNPFSMVAIVLTITAIFAVINDRIIKLHRTIGVMLIALVMSLCIIAAKQLGFIQDDVMTELIGRFNFGETLIQGMLGALLFGDAINQPLAEAPLSLWALLAGQAEHLGDHELPDLEAIIAHVTQSVGTPEFGKPRLPPGHDEIRFTPQESLELLWQPFVASLLQALEVPAADWPLACGLAIQELMAQGKDVLAPHLAATIVMECAVPMSKIVMKN